MLKENIEKLKTEDIYSILMFTLFQLKKVSSYSTLSELVYVLDEENFLKLCSKFGGMTIRIPEKEELDVVIKSLLLYTYVNIEDKEMDESLNLITRDEDMRKKIRKTYPIIEDVMREYEFGNH